MRFPISCAIAAAICAAVLGGCASGRSELAIDTPAAAVDSSVDESAPSIAIRSVSDLRVFEQEPKEPSTPSLGLGGADGATETAKMRAVGRKYNGHGEALGDVLLVPSSTVSNLIRRHFAAAAAGAGYRVVDAGDADVAVDIMIERFWSWTDPGPSKIGITSVVETDVIFTGRNHTETVSVRTREGYDLITDAVWRANIQQALATYRDEVTAVLSKR